MSFDSLTTGLNAEQLRATQVVDGPLLILAGAGSGKTKTITHRIAHLLSRGVPAWNILAVTFTNKAAGELKERIARMLHLADGAEPSSSSLPVSGTFHSLCVRILRRDSEAISRDRSFVIYDTDDQLKAMDTALKALSITPQELKPRTALSQISMWKSEAISPSEARVQASSFALARMVDIYTRYQDSLRQSNAMDFDDLLLETLRLFRERPDVLSRYQNTWKYIHVDEYQDTNRVQYLLVSLLAQAHRNLCVIGDPDQSIYAFRGADIRNILNFQTEYPDAVSITLERNYRSTQQILDAADGVIAQSPNRPPKKMWTDQTNGSNIRLEEVGDERAEAVQVLKHVLAQKTAGIPLSEQVVLYRTNAQSRLFEEACLRFGVPYRILGGVKFYARKEVKDILAYLFVTLNPDDTISLLRILNVPARKIGDTTVMRLQNFCNERSLTLWQAIRHIEMVDGLNEPTRLRLQNFASIIDRARIKMSEVTVHELAEFLIQTTSFEAFLRDHTEEGEERWRNVQELLTVMKKYDHLRGMDGLTNFLEEVALISEVDKLDADDRDSLTLMTLHLCKGLEFTSVALVGCEEGLLPHSSSLFDGAQVEEERRLLYVGMTRAKKHLALFHAMSRSMWGNTQVNARSRFLDSIPASVLEVQAPALQSKYGWLTSSQKHPSTLSSFGSSVSTPTAPLPFNEFNQELPESDDDSSFEEIEEGTVIEHKTLGRGTVLDRRGDIADIQFESGARKRLALNIAPVRIVK